MMTLTSMNALRSGSATKGGARFARAAVAAVAQVWVAWKNRRAVAELAGYDDYMLKDIGITRGDLNAALSGRLHRDPSTRLVVLAVERRAAHRERARETLARRHAEEGRQNGDKQAERV